MQAMANKRTTKKPAGAKNENALAKGDEAARYWEDHVAPLIKGIKVSNLPGMFHVPVNAGRWATRELLWGDHVLNVAEWSGVGKDIAAMMEEDDPAWKLPKNWSYERLASKLAPGEVPHEFDVPNPRHYGLDGVQSLPSSHRNYAELVHREFRDRMCRIWEHAHLRDPLSADDVFSAFLDHHHERGGDLLPYLKKKFLRDYDSAMWHWPSPAMPTSEGPSEVELKGEMKAAVINWVAQVEARRVKDAEVLPLVAQADVITPVLINAVERIDRAIAAMEVGTVIAKAEKQADDAVIGEDVVPAVRSLAQRLDAKPGAREAFDEFLLRDGFTDDQGNYVSNCRKGKGEIIATWDVVSEFFKVEGFGKDHEALQLALIKYIKGLSIGSPRKLRDTYIYRDQIARCQGRLRESAKGHIPAHSGEAE
jgi:hypothetical protein